MFWFVLIVLLLFVWTFGLLALAGPNLDQYDTPVGEIFPSNRDDAAADAQFIGILKKVRQDMIDSKSIGKGLNVVREFADKLSADLESDCEFREVTANGVRCEWAIAPNVNTARRVLFLHGGAFLFGTPNGHRKYAHTLSHLANAAVLSVDYRLLPENRRPAATADAQQAYRWILQHGPDGKAPVEWLLVAGDSAGGNLALILSSWSKQQTLRKPDGVIAFSPNADATLCAPSYKLNRKTDVLLGPALGMLARLPLTLRVWIGLISMRGNPSNPLISPLFGDLSNLPPTLIHTSSSELMLGDAIRYTNKARAAGSDVTLQIWENQLHDWHLFNMGTGSANHAWREVGRFIRWLDGQAGKRNEESPPAQALA